MGIFSKVKIEPVGDDSIYHNVYIDGVRQSNVARADVSYSRTEMPQAVITFNSVINVDEEMAVTYRFEPSDIRECIRFLALQLQLDKDLHDAWQSSIYSALKDLRAKDEGTGDYICDYDRAGYILDRLME